MSASVAVVPHLQKSARPDIAWIRKNVPVLEVGKALGLRIRHRRAKCWRPENHTHGDTDPSLHFHERKNRVRCFVCDMRGGHSNLDLVMGVLGVSVGDAVRWIADRFTVPNVKPGRPVGSQEVQPAPYRVGVHGSEWEVIVRSGMWGAMSSAERSILVVLDYFKDSETGITRMSYRAIMRYSGVKKMANVSDAIKELKKMHALQAVPGPRIGVTRECSSYHIMIDDPRFVEFCNEVYRIGRERIAQERDYRRQLRAQRQAQEQRGAAPLCAPLSPSQRDKEKPATCKGPHLSSPREVHANKALPAGKREISFSGQLSIEEQKQVLRERGWLQ